MIGQAYATLGQLNKARDHLSRALDIRGGLEGADPLETYEIRWTYTHVLQDMGDPWWRLKWWKLFHQIPRIVVDSHPDLAQALIAFEHASQGNISPAAISERYQAAMELAEALDENDPLWLLVADCIHLSAFEMSLKVDADTACTYLRRALHLYRRFHPDTHTRIVRTMSLLIANLLSSGQYEEVEALARHSLTALAGKLPVDHWYLGLLRARLAASLMRQGRHQEAEPILEDSLRRVLETRGPDSVYYSEVMAYVIEFYQSAGRDAEASKLRNEFATVLARMNIGPRDAELAYGQQHARLFKLVNQLYQGGQTGSTMARTLNQMIPLWRASLPDEHPLSALTAHLLRGAGFREYGQRGFNDQTYVLFKEAARICERNDFLHPLRKATGLFWYGYNCEARGEYEEAERYLRQAIAIEQAQEQPPPP